MKKFVFCGGHHNSSLVIAERLVRRGEKVFWFGHKYSMIGDKNPSAEYLEVTGKGIPFYEIKAGKIQLKDKFFQNLLRIPSSFFQSLFILRKIKPNMIFSSGGYLSVPIVLAGVMLSIPVVTHEQTTTIGLANKLISKFAKKIFVSYKSSIPLFPVNKVIYSGLPLRPEIFTHNKRLFSNNKKTIYITGGKQGAHVINENFFIIAPKVLERFNIIHQCGSTSLYDDIKKALKIKEELGELERNYLVKEYFFSEEIGNVLFSADFVISRAGAHIVSELLALRKPAILIPIPWSSYNEQEKNALMLEKSGLGLVLNQEELKKGKLWEVILDFEKKLPGFKLKKEEEQVIDPTGTIIKEIDLFFQNKT